MLSIFKIIGVIGLILIIYGTLKRKKQLERIFLIPGGICLLIYSIYIKDLFFIILQLSFIIIESYEYYKSKSPLFGKPNIKHLSKKRTNKRTL